jgi:anti-sigma B factor antagonist
MPRASAGPHHPTVISVNGEIDVVKVSAMRQKIDAAIEAGHIHVLVDLTAVRFMEATLLHALLAGRKSCVESGGSLSVTVLSPSARARLQGPPRPPG